MTFDNDEIMLYGFLDLREVLIEYNIEIYEAMLNNEPINNLVSDFKQSSIKQNPNYQQALNSLNLVNIYNEDKNITLPFLSALKRQNIDLEDVFKNEYNDFLKKLEYSLDKPEAQTDFNNYMKKLNDMYSKDFHYEVDFKDYVKTLTRLRKKVDFQINLDISKLKVRDLKLDRDDFLTTHDAIYEIVDEAKKIESFEILQLVNEDGETDKKNQKSLTTFLKDILWFGVNNISNYFSNVPEKKDNKQFVLYLALYLCANEFESIERFMNLNGFSLRARYQQLHNFTHLKNAHINDCLSVGLSREVIYFYLKHFGRTRQNAGTFKPIDGFRDY